MKLTRIHTYGKIHQLKFSYKWENSHFKVYGYGITIHGPEVIARSLETAMPTLKNYIIEADYTILNQSYPKELYKLHFPAITTT